MRKKEEGRSKADLLMEAALRSVEAEENLTEDAPIAIDMDEAPIAKKGATINHEHEDDKQREARLSKGDPKDFVKRDEFLRVAADFENFRRRAHKDRQEAERGGSEKVLRGFLDILDNLLRGLSDINAEESPLAAGMHMTLSQAEIWLRSLGLERIETVGKQFNPEFHEAISQVASDAPSGQIVQELKCGYRWPDRLLRAASVVVSMGPADGSEGNN